MGRGPFLIPIAILIAVLVVASLVAAFTFAPLRPVNFSKDYYVPDVSAVKAVKLNFDSDVADVSVIPTVIPNDIMGNGMVRLHVFATGLIGFLGNVDQPVRVTLDQQVVGNIATVTAHVARTVIWPVSGTLKVTCNVYVNIRTTLDLDVRTSVGSVTMNPSVAVEFQGLSLRSTTGTVDATLTDIVTLPTAVTFSTTTGSVHLTWINARITGNTKVNLATTTGSVDLNIAQHKDLAGSVTIDAATTTGSVNPSLNISGNVGAQITSHASLSSISTSVQNFNGNRSPIYSSNYPATNNFLISTETTTGSVNINASYAP
jgi:hypothetical protein